MDTVESIIDKLAGRLIPEEMTLEGATPPGYEEKLQNAYRERMRRRAHRVLQTISPSDRRSILRFLENEEDVREAKSLLDDLGYDEESIHQMNGMGRHLVKSKEQIINQAHSHLLDEHELMGVFVGGASEAQVSPDHQQ
jgi:hypothetical protein